MQSRCHPLIHISGYQFHTLKLPFCGEKEKKRKADRWLIILFTLGWGAVAGYNLYPTAQHLCIHLFTHHLKSTAFLFSDMDFEGISIVRNTLGWEEICLFLWLSCFLYFINCNLFSFLNTTCKKKVYPRQHRKKC